MCGHQVQAEVHGSLKVPVAALTSQCQSHLGHGGLIHFRQMSIDTVPDPFCCNGQRLRCRLRVVQGATALRDVASQA